MPYLTIRNSIRTFLTAQIPAAINTITPAISNELIFDNNVQQDYRGDRVLIYVEIDIVSLDPIGQGVHQRKKYNGTISIVVSNDIGAGEDNVIKITDAILPKIGNNIQNSGITYMNEQYGETNRANGKFSMTITTDYFTEALL